MVILTVESAQAPCAAGAFDETYKILTPQWL